MSPLRLHGPCCSSARPLLCPAVPLHLPAPGPPPWGRGTRTGTNSWGVPRTADRWRSSVCGERETMASVSQASPGTTPLLGGARHRSAPVLIWGPAPVCSNHQDPRRPEETVQAFDSLWFPGYEATRVDHGQRRDPGWGHIFRFLSGPGLWESRDWLMVSCSWELGVGSVERPRGGRRPRTSMRSCPQGWEEPACERGLPGQWAKTG